MWLVLLELDKLCRKYNFCIILLRFTSYTLVIFLRELKNMENVTIKQAEQINNKILLENRNKLNITGVTKMISSNETLIVMQVKNTRLTVCGKAIRIEKLDIENGILDASGEFDSIKYSDHGGVFKRIFK